MPLLYIPSVFLLFFPLHKYNNTIIQISSHNIFTIQNKLTLLILTWTSNKPSDLSFRFTIQNKLTSLICGLTSKPSDLSFRFTIKNVELHTTTKFHIFYFSNFFNSSSICSFFTVLSAEI